MYTEHPRQTVETVEMLFWHIGKGSSPVISLGKPDPRSKE
jgi:hypothetical protein